MAGAIGFAVFTPLLGTMLFFVIRRLTSGRSKQNLSDAMSRLDNDGLAVVGSGRRTLKIDGSGFKYFYGRTEIFERWSNVDGKFDITTDFSGRKAVVYYRISVNRRKGILGLIVSKFPKPRWNRRIHSVKGMDPEEVALLLNKARERFTTGRLTSKAPVNT